MADKEFTKIEAAQEQEVLTRGEMIQMIHEARQNAAKQKNLNKDKLYKPNFKLSKDYEAVAKKADEAAKAGDYKLAEALSKEMLSIQLNGAVDSEEYQKAVDQSLEMPIASVFTERKKYEAVITECEEKLANFDVSSVQSQIDALGDQYNKKIRAAKYSQDVAILQAEYEKEAAALEHELITIPMNDLKIKRFEAKEYLLIYEARIKAYIGANEELIRAEEENAKREEIRGSLADLLEELEREDAKKAALGLEG